MNQNRHSNKQTPHDTSWDKVADWYDKHISEGSDYHKDVIIPGVIRMLKPKTGEKILDIGCGEGVLCRKLANLNVQATGIDASTKLIEIAKRKTPKEFHVEYKVADAEKLDGFSDDNFNAACSILAIQNMENIDNVIKGTGRALRKNGRLLLVFNHPCFRVPRQSGWGYDEKRKLQYRRVDRYMSPIKIPIQMHPGSSPDVYTWTFHRPLSEYFSVLNENGLVVSKFEEWVSHRKSKPGARAKAENVAREEIPLFAAILAIKK